MFKFLTPVKKGEFWIFSRQRSEEENNYRHDFVTSSRKRRNGGRLRGFGASGHFRGRQTDFILRGRGLPIRFGHPLPLSSRPSIRVTLLTQILFLLSPSTTSLFARLVLRADRRRRRRLPHQLPTRLLAPSAFFPRHSRRRPSTAAGNDEERAGDGFETLPR